MYNLLLLPLLLLLLQLRAIILIFHCFSCPTLLLIFAVNPLFQRLRQETLHGVAVPLPTTSTAISQDTAKSRDSISRESAVITRTNSTDSTILSRPHTAGTGTTIIVSTVTRS